MSEVPLLRWSLSGVVRSTAILKARSLHARPFVPSIKSHFWKILSSFDDKCPQNGSKNGLRAPRTGMGCPYIGPSVDLIDQPAR